MQQEDTLETVGLIGDQPTNRDYLGFQPYVLAVAAFLTDASTIPPLTLSVEGEWGSGKSSFLKQLKEELIPEWKRPFYSACFYPWQFNKKRQRRYSVNFNPWRYSENEALWAAFAVEFERQVFKKAPWQRKVWFKICQIDYAKLGWDLFKIVIPAFAVFLATWLLPGIFDKIKDSDFFRIIVALFVLIPAFFPAKEAFKELQDKITKNLMSLKFKDYLLERPNYNGKIPFLDKFHEDIQQLAGSLCGTDRIYVFIDDLDRCEPGQALELMQALNLLISDELKIIFILAIDRKKVAAGYAAKHSHLVQYLDPVEFRLGEPQAERFKIYAAVQYGYEFLEKFIQVPFQLPIPKQPNLNQLLNHIVKFKRIESSTSRDQEKVPKATPAVPQKLEPPKAEPISAPFRIEESPAIAQDIMAMIAPALGNNPRRIKKFFNIFRLQTYIGSRTGLFAMKWSSDNYQEGLSPVQLAKVHILAQVWPHFIDHWQQYRYFMLYLRDYISKKHWSDHELEEFKRTVCSMATFLPGSEEAEQYWKLFIYWSKQKLLVDLLKYKTDEGEKYQIWAIPIGEMLKVAPVYKTEQFTIPSLISDTSLQDAEVSSSEVSIRSIDPSKVPSSEYSAVRVGEILKEVEEYLNANLKEGETRYFLEGPAAEAAYVMRANSRTLADIKTEIDRIQGRSSNLYTEEQIRQEAIQNWLGGEESRYQESREDKAIIEGLLNEIQLEVSNNEKYPQSLDEGVVESIQVMYRNGTPREQIKTEILKYLSTPIDSETTVVKPEGHFDAFEDLFRIGPGIRNPITGEWEDSPKNYHDGLSDESRSKLRASEDWKDWRGLERNEIRKMQEDGELPPRSLLDEAYEIAPYDTEQIMDELERELNLLRSEGQVPYKLSGKSAELAYEYWEHGKAITELKQELDKLQMITGNSSEGLERVVLEERQSEDGYVDPHEFPSSTTGIRNPITGKIRPLKRNKNIPHEASGLIELSPQHPELSEQDMDLPEQTNPRAIFSHIIREIRAERPDIANSPFEDQVEELSLILLERGESAENVKRQIVDYLYSPNRINEAQTQGKASFEQKPFAYDTEGQGYDEGYWDEKPSAIGGLLGESSPQNPPRISNQASELETRIREATWNEISEPWEKLDGTWGESRYVQETKNPVTGEWENPTYIGKTNPNVDSWENIDRVKSIDTGELYTDEEWAKIQRKQAENPERPGYDGL